jgi:hypothetical protein
MNSAEWAAIFGVAGSVAGFTFGHSFTYFTDRRDSWLDARASGLLLLSAVRISREDAEAEDGRVDVAAALAVWDANKHVLVKFRRGRYPSGLKSRQWLDLASRFETLERLEAKRTFTMVSDKDREACRAVLGELRQIEAVLRPFGRQGAVALYVISPRLARWWKRVRKAIKRRKSQKT